MDPFRDPGGAERALARLGGSLPEERLAFAAVEAEVLRRLAEVGSPDRGLTNLERYADAFGSRLSLFRTLAEDPAARDRALVLFSASQYFADILIREPRLLFWLGGQGGRPSREALLEEARGTVAALADDEHKLDALRRLKRREVLAVGYRDHVLGRPLEETVADLSAIADSLLEAALGVAIAGRFGRRYPAIAALRPLPFAVVALGKLGGLELNYSSDIDLLFVHDEGGGGATPPGEAEEVFERLARDYVAVLTRFTAAEGSLFRVDLRLRPEGGIGAPSRTVPSYVAYYETYGRTWERQALLKARVAAGDRALGARFLAALEPFVYRRRLDFEGIAEVKALRRRIEERALHSGTGAGTGAAMPEDVKEGVGGIRDIEFAVQFLLLLYGADSPAVRDPSTLGTIAKLAAEGLIERDEARAMREAYIFLRRVEHGLQTLHSLQTHVLPRDPAEREDLARRLRYRGKAQAALAAFEADLAAHGRAARRALDRLLRDLFPAAEGAAEATSLLLGPALEPERVRAVLARYGLADAERARDRIARLAREESRFLASSSRARTFLASLLPRLLRAVADTPSPDDTLARFERITATLGGKAVFYQLLAEHPDALSLFVDLCAYSPFLRDQLERGPGLLDEVVDLLLTGERADLETVAARLRDQPLEAVAAIHRSYLLLIGIRDLGERANVANTLDEELALADAVARSGRPRQAAAFAVLGLGKLGGREVGYGSDLDLVAACEEEGETDAGAAATELFARAVQTLIRLGREAGLYEMDLRLRPGGQSAPLVPTFAALEAYYREPATRGAATWERLAATKLRAVAGDLGAGERLVLRVRDAIYAAPPPADLREATLEMRRRIEAAAEGRDLKRGAGGLVDIEFAVAYLKLAHGGTGPKELRAATNVVESLHALARAALLAPAAYGDLLTAYQLLRKIEGRLRVARNRPVSRLPDDPAELRLLAKRLGYVDTPRKPAESSFEAELDYHLARTRRRFEEIVGAG